MRKGERSISYPYPNMAERAPVCPGYVMSTRQLSILWEYDLWLGHTLMDLPHRKCKAVPIDLPTDFPPMSLDQFLILAEQIRKMWVFASFHFKCKNTRNGWGLFFSDEYGDNVRELSSSNGVVMGWLAKAPAVGMCPTAHRYLRSPCRLQEIDQHQIYLGGPISMSNFDPMDRVKCKRCISTKEPRLNKMAVSKAHSRKVTPGQEVLWSYGMNKTDKWSPNFYSPQEWQLLETCCTEEEKQFIAFLQLPTYLPETSGSSTQTRKKRKVSIPFPQKNNSPILSFKFCTYCGINVASLPKKSTTKENMKRHWALKHAKELCEEMGVDTESAEDPVSSKKFLMHLDKVDKVYHSLINRNYKVAAACNFLDKRRNLALDPSAPEADKASVFSNFVREGQNLFEEFQVLYLKGIEIPKKYEDLFKPEKNSNYSSVNWQGDEPSTINFSLNQHDVTDEEKDILFSEVEYQLVSLVVGWQKGPSFAF